MHTAARTGAPDTVHEHLAEARHSGLVLVDQHNRSRHLRELP
ncbi:hypothetical protein [Streptomyces sp. NPDC087859]